ncbi:MAG: selenocysteine-specific translation elongation factor [Kofleriaceae bacterium]
MSAAAYPLILGTAGHIDHGKTSLVRALTGIDTDRLPVEKARGITTELGFAYLDLGARRLAVVDVPGHERFVKAMVAGATGLDLVCMVIASDEGVMPQTREHLDICHLLGVRRGLVVLTKHDLVDSGEWRAMIHADVTAAVAGTFLAGAKLVEVSTRTGHGLDALRAELAALAAECPPRPASGVYRQAVDRVFTIKGFGTVVTGTILGGAVRVGDELELLPSGRRSRVRGLEVHGAAVESAHAGMRAAVNLGGTALDEVARGDLLVHPGRVAGSHILDVRFTYVAGARSDLGARTKVLVHHAASQVTGSLVLVEGARLAPGETALAQLRLDASAPLGAMPGDRFILRGFAAVASYGTTLGGGEIVRVLAPKARRATDHAATVAALAGARRADRAALLVQTAAAAGLTRVELARRLGAEPEELGADLEAAVAGGELMATGERGHAHYLHATAVAELERRVVEAAHGSPEGALREDLRTHLPAALPVRAYDELLARLAAARRVVVDGERVRRVEPAAPAAPTLSAAETALLARVRAAGVEPPRPKELPELVKQPEPVVRAALDRLVAQKLLTKVKPDLLMDRAVVDALRTKLLAHFESHAELTPQQWKDLVGASRKFTIPLAEFFDAEKLTLRVGDVRRRRK